MPRTKRAPIDYAPQFGGGIFRSKDAVESDLALIEQEPARKTPPSDEPLFDAAQAVAPTRPVDDRTIERTNERTRVRHSFDIWQDQLVGLAEIQTQIFNATGRKPKLGDLVQEALDIYIAKQKH